MKAIILAAGRGSRMGTLTEDIPKCLVQFADKPLLQWQMDALRAAGIQETGIVRGYMGHRLDLAGVHLFENTRWAETNMVSSLLSASEWLRNDTCIVTYSDIVYDSNAVMPLIRADGDIVITYNTEWLELWKLRFDDPLSDAETFRTNSSGSLVEIGGRTDSVDNIQGQYMGLLKFTPSGWKMTEEFIYSLSPRERDRIDVTSLLKRMISAGIIVSTTAVKGGWLEVDSERDLLLYSSRGGLNAALDR